MILSLKCYMKSKLVHPPICKINFWLKFRIILAWTQFFLFLSLYILFDRFNPIFKNLFILTWNLRACGSSWDRFCLMRNSRLFIFWDTYPLNSNTLCYLRGRYSFMICLNIGWWHWSVCPSSMLESSFVKGFRDFTVWKYHACVGTLILHSLFLTNQKEFKGIPEVDSINLKVLLIG